jgi:hypothetical protein
MCIDLFRIVGYLVEFAFVIACVAGTLAAARGAFASPEMLESMGKFIGTKNPVVARIVCFVGLVVCPAACAGSVMVIVLIGGF